MIWEKCLTLNILDNNKKIFIEALEKSNGIVTTACNSTGLSRSTYYHWYNNDAEFKEACDAAQEIAIDFVESKLMEKINGVTMLGKGNDEQEPTYTLPPSDTAIIFYLKTKGKKRGYVEKTEVDHSGTLGINWNETKTYDPNDKTDTGS